MNKAHKTIIKELGAGLILRRSSPADAEALDAFCGMIHSEDPDKPDERIGAWAHDLVARPHPTFHADDFTVIEETSTGRIVSTLNLISQRWTYEGVEFGVGRPELVGTLPEFRNRGLIRLQFEEIHKWSAERGEMVQAITGIPYYYRLFGYEMAIELDCGRTGFELNVPKLEKGASESFRFRPAVEADIPFLMKVYAHAARRNMVYVVRDQDIWRYEISGRSANNVNRLEWEIIERVQNGEPVGFLAHPWFGWETCATAMMYELKPGCSWLDVTPSVVRRLWALMQAYTKQDGKPRSSFTFFLGEQHPVYEVMHGNLPRLRKPYAWYIRVADLPVFIRHVSPALEKRLAESLMPCFSGEVKISFYDRGLQLAFEKGRLSNVENWMPAPRAEGDAAFPNRTFLQLLFGYRTLEELRASYADCWWNNDTAYLLLSTLFPRKFSTIPGIV